MKKLSLLLMAVLAFTFMGCGEWLDIPDPEPDPDPEPEPIEEALITLETTEATLHSGETFQIVAECEYPITYTSENEYYATVSEDGLVTANFVGNTTITLESESDSQTFEVTIEPVSDLYPEPEIEIGESKDAIIERFGDPSEEEEEIILYYGYAESSFLLMVAFDEEDLVQYYAVVMEFDYVEELETFLSERYMFVNEQDGVKVYINALDVNDATLIVGSQVVEESFVMAVYMGNDEGGGGEEGKGVTPRVPKALKRLAK